MRFLPIWKARKVGAVMGNNPPFTITEKAADYLAKIAEIATRLEFDSGFKRDIKLHRENRVRTIYSSLAIEGNLLSLGEVAAVIDGKLVAGRQADVKEVKNAYEAYDKIMTFNPYSISDFLQAHKLITDGLIAESGKFRSGDVGVFNGATAVHIGARPQFVPSLMEELFRWAKESALHPVLKSAILHYEIETIHPFEDGNGRMGRLWQTLVLAKWKEVFAWIPMESVLYDDRSLYYKAIENARATNDSGVFIEFILSSIVDIMAVQEKHQVKLEEKHQVKLEEKHQVHLSSIQLAVLFALEGGSLSRREIFALINKSNDSRSFSRNIKPLILCGFVEMSVPDKPNSSLQRYQLTDSGKERVMIAKGL